VSSHGTEGSECIQSPIGGIDVTADIDWKTLRDKATEAAGNAYAPYSRFPSALRRWLTTAEWWPAAMWRMSHMA